jgi:hypothetical protein
MHMGDFFERSVDGINAFNTGNSGSYNSENFGLSLSDTDTSIFAADTTSYNDSLDVVKEFLRQDTSVGNVSKEQQRIIKELYGSYENFQIEEENFFEQKF